MCVINQPVGSRLKCGKMKRCGRYVWVLIVAVLLTVCVYFTFNSGRVMTCFWGLAMAATLFWMRERHTIAYRFTEVIAGVFILGQYYSNGRGGLSAGFFAEAFQTFHWNVVLVTTLGAVYVMVRGFDNIKRGMTASA
jgi:hypothetical protein